jgi:hypothetical protein
MLVLFSNYHPSNIHAHNKCPLQEFNFNIFFLKKYFNFVYLLLFLIQPFSFSSVSSPSPAHMDDNEEERAGAAGSLGGFLLIFIWANKFWIVLLIIKSEARADRRRVLPLTTEMWVFGVVEVDDDDGDGEAALGKRVKDEEYETRERSVSERQPDYPNHTSVFPDLTGSTQTKRINPRTCGLDTTRYIY